jgi:predicted HicB family RNase H-like nuclease
MVMQRKGYIATVEYDESVGLFHGRVTNARAVITFEGETGRDLEREFDGSICDYEEMCAEDGVEPERPYSGRFVIRIAPAVHAQLAAMAAVTEKSLNELVRETLEQLVAGGAA